MLYGSCCGATKNILIKYHVVVNHSYIVKLELACREIYIGKSNFYQ